MGSNLEAIQIASSCRKYLDSIGRHEVRITLLDPKISEVRSSFGPEVYAHFKEILRSH
jgi:hypothetical protein